MLAQLRTSLRRAGRRVSRRVDLSPLTEWRGRGTPPGLRTAKTTLAAVISWELARRLTGSEAPVLAPLTALLVTQLTVVETITESFQRVGAVVVGDCLGPAGDDMGAREGWSFDTLRDVPHGVSRVGEPVDRGLLPLGFGHEIQVVDGLARHARIAQEGIDPQRKRGRADRGARLRR